MKKIVLFTIFYILFLPNQIFADEDKCNQHKKFSMEYMKCKTDLLKKKTINTSQNLKKKTISAGKNIIKDTKEYQSKEWSENKEKINKIKKKVLD